MHGGRGTSPLTQVHARSTPHVTPGDAPVSRGRGVNLVPEAACDRRFHDVRVPAENQLGSWGAVAVSHSLRTASSGALVTATSATNLPPCPLAWAVDPSLPPAVRRTLPSPWAGLDPQSGNPRMRRRDGACGGQPHTRVRTTRATGTDSCLTYPDRAGVGLRTPGGVHTAYFISHETACPPPRRAPGAARFHRVARGVELDARVWDGRRAAREHERGAGRRRTGFGPALLGRRPAPARTGSVPGWAPDARMPSGGDAHPVCTRRTRRRPVRAPGAAGGAAAPAGNLGVRARSSVRLVALPSPAGLSHLHTLLSTRGDDLELLPRGRLDCPRGRREARGRHPEEAP